MTCNNDNNTDFHTLPMFSLPDEILTLMIKFRIKKDPFHPLLGKHEFLKTDFFQIISKNGISNIGGFTGIVLINQPKGALRINKKVMIYPSPINSVKLAQKHKIPNLLLIYFFELSNEEKEDLFNRITNESPMVHPYVWDISDVTHYLGYDPFNPLEFYKNLLDNLEESHELLNEFQEDSIENLKLKYGEISLFLGAGVSKEYNIPSWDKLIEKLTLEIYSRLLKDKLSVEEIQQIIQYIKNGNNMSRGTDSFFVNMHQIESSVFKTLYNDDFVKILKKSL